MLKEGQSVALITDAGMPCISDPGAILVNEARAAGLEISVIPGASAAVSAYALSGNLTNGFCFLGFLPEKNGAREKLLASVKDIPVPLVLYCAPHDLNKYIEVLYKNLGKRDLWAVKELTKIYESVYIGNTETIEIASDKGEFVLLVGENKEDAVYNEEDITAVIISEADKGKSSNDIVKLLTAQFKISKNEAYKFVLDAIKR
jgi:16S rRNA (cytidine1402-2'-O)-methyltransferase